MPLLAGVLTRQTNCLMPLKTFLWNEFALYNNNNLQQTINQKYNETHSTSAKEQDIPLVQDVSVYDIRAI